MGLDSTLFSNFFLHRSVINLDLSSSPPNVPRITCEADGGHRTTDEDRRRGFGRCRCMSAGFRRPIEELNYASLQRILSADDEQTIVPNQLFEQLRTVSQVVCGGADVGSNRLLHQSIQIVPEVGREQSLNGGPHAVNDRPQVAGLVFCRPLKLFDGGQDCPALGVAEDYHQPRAETRAGKLDAADLRGSNDVSGNTNNKQVPQALIKHDFGRNARIRTPEDDRERLLPRG